MFASATLPAEPTSPGAARLFVRATLADWELTLFEDIACLLVSELVTNALLHAASSSELSLGYQGGVLHVAVGDESAQRVRPRAYSRDAGTGRGLMLVAALSAQWGSSATAIGKEVWFELDSVSVARGTD
ncbi:MAG: ATP-binding protein [Mycobacteriales bacterium]